MNLAITNCRISSEGRAIQRQSTFTMTDMLIENCQISAPGIVLNDVDRLMIRGIIASADFDEPVVSLTDCDVVWIEDIAITQLVA